MDNSFSLFSDNTALYFYSALLQANAAILSIVGVFVIFKVQSLKSSIDIVKSALMNYKSFVTQPMVINFANVSIEEKRKIASGADGYIKPQYDDWIQKEIELSTTKSLIKVPTILLVVAIMLEALGLTTATFFHLCYPKIEFLLLCSNLIYEAFVLIFVVKGVFKIVSS